MKFNLNKKTIVLFTSIVFLLFFSKIVFAVWNGTFYDPGDTLNPECLPTDTDCDVRAPLTSLNISDLDYDESTWDGDTTHAPSKNAIRDKIETLATISHNAVTIGATPNGLSLAAQVLSLALSSTSTTGALSDTDWNIFNNKAPALGADDNYVTDAQLVVVGNTSGTNSGDNAANTTYADDYRAANFVAGTNYLAPNGSAAALTSFPTLNQDTTGNAGTVTNGVYTNAANSMSVINPLTTLAESWIGPSSTTGIYFKDGNVGIGTTTPAYPLDIVKNQDGFSSIIMRNNSTGASARFALQITQNGTTQGGSFGYANSAFNIGASYTAMRANSFYISTASGASGGLSFISSSTTAPITFTLGGYQTSTNEKVRITVDGNVGIGVIAPDGKLTVKGTGTTTGTNFLLEDSSGADKFLVTDAGTITATGPILINGVAAGKGLVAMQQSTDANTGGFAILSSNGGNSLRYWVDASGNMRIDNGLDATGKVFINGAGNPGGNVGIGTITADGKLTVKGSGTTTGTNFLLEDSTGADKVLITDAGTTAITPTDSSALTDVLVNPTTKTSGNLLDLQVNGSSKFSVTNLGVITGASHFATAGIITSTYTVPGSLGAFRYTSTITDTANQYILRLAPTYNQTSGTAANTDLLINRTETAVGSGTQLLIDAQVGGVSKFKVDNTGRTTITGTLNSTINTDLDIQSYQTFSTSTKIGVDMLRGSTFSQTSGQQVGVKIEPAYNQTSGTAANTDLLINRTQTAVGSGAQLLIDAQVSGSTKFNVDNAGAVHASVFYASSGYHSYSSNATLAIQNLNLTSATYAATLGGGTYSQAAGSNGIFKIVGTYNQTGGSTAANTDLLINRTETAVGSGAQNLIDAQVATVSKWKVDNTGASTQTGAVTAPNLAFSSAASATTGYLTSTSDATKGSYSLNAAGTIVVDELNTRLGIGTSVPTFPLHVHSASAGGRATFTYGATAANATLLAMGINDTSTYFQSAKTGSGTARRFGIWDATAEQFTLLQGGNVGINNTAPDAKLTVKGAGTTTGQNFLLEDSTGADTLKILDNGTIQQTPVDSSALTDFLINPATKTSGNLIDLQVNGSSKFKVTSTGTVTSSGSYTSSGNLYAAAGSVFGNNGRSILSSPSDGNSQIENWGQTAFANLTIGKLISNITNTATSGTINVASITPTYNQASGTAANTDLLINRTQTAVGSGAQNLIDAQVATVSKWRVDNTGASTQTGAVTAPNLAFSSAASATTGYLTSTSDATKGSYSLNAAGTIVVDELNTRLGIGTAIPSAYLQIKAGTATAGTAPLKFTSGTLLTTPEIGAVEFDGNSFYGSININNFVSSYPLAQSDTYVKATSKYDTSFWPYYATDPAKSVTGSQTSNSWVGANGSITNQRFHMDLGSAVIVTRVYYENAHHSGGSTGGGVKNFTLWGSNDANAFAELTYGIDTNWTQLVTSQSTFDRHVSADQVDPKYIAVTNDTAYRYYAFKFADRWSTESWMGVRRLELQTEGTIGDRKGIVLNDGTDLVSGRIPFATTNGRLTDNTNFVFNGTNFGIGDTSPSALLTVGSGDLFQVNSSGAIAASTGITTTGNLTLSGSSANVVLGSNYLSGDGGDEGIYVDSSGNVGIGTTSPGYNLDIQKAGIADTFIGMQVKDTSAGSTPAIFGSLRNTGDTFSLPGIWFTADTPTMTNYSFMGSGSTAIFNAPTAGSIYFRINNTNALRLTPNRGLSLGSTFYTTDPGLNNLIVEGNVGIGTASPTSRIHGVTTLSAATGNEVAYSLDYTTNKATSGNDTGLLINMTDTLSPGTSYPLDIKVGASSVFNVNNVGRMYASAGIDVGSGGSSSFTWLANFSFTGGASTVIPTIDSYPTYANTGTGLTTASFKIRPTYNMPSATGAINTDLLINRTETSLGTTPGAQNLIDAQVATVSKWKVDNTGATTQTGAVTAPSLAFSSTASATSGYLTSTSNATKGSYKLTADGNIYIDETKAKLFISNVSNQADYPLQVTRVSNGTTGIGKTAGSFGVQTDADMVDGFGPLLFFAAQDSSGVRNNLAAFGGSRDGADTKGAISFYTWDTAYSGAGDTKLKISNAGNLGLGLFTFGTNATKTFAVGTGVAPASSPVDGFQMYSADIAAGNAAPHFRTENGTIIKLDQSLDTTASPTFATITTPSLAFSSTASATTGYLTSTSNATKGSYSLNAAGTIVVDELNTRLGIGTASPGAKLEVNQATDGVLGLRVNGAAGNWAQYINNTAAAGSSYGLEIFAGGDSTDYAIATYARDGVTPYFFVRGDGNVGIGTTSPTQALTFSSGKKIAWENNGVGTGQATIFQDTDGVLNFNREIRIEGDGSGNGVAVFGVKGLTATSAAYATDIAGDTSNRFLTLVNGSMSWGVGTSPTDVSLSRIGVGQLGITGTGVSVLGIYDNSATGYSGLSLKGTGTQNYSLTMGGPSETAFSMANKFGIYDGLNGAFRFVVDSTGNVGIGTTTPNTKLYISDSANNAYASLNIVRTVADPTNVISGMNSTATINATSANSQSAYGLTFSAASGTDAYNRTGTFFGLQGFAYHYGTGTMSAAIGGKMGVRVGADSPGTITSATGLQIASGISSGKSGTITNNYDVYLNTPILGTGGTIVNDYGLYIANRAGSTLNYSIYSAGGSMYHAGSVGIGTVPGQKLSVLGAAGDTTVVSFATTSGNTCSFTTVTGAFSCASDERLKNTILSIGSEDALAKIAQLNPVTFRYNWQNQNDSLVSGFIAQEFENIFPELVSTDPVTSYKSLSYAPLMPYVVKAIQELNLNLESVAGTVIPSPESSSETFASAFFTNIKTTIGVWLADTANGVTDVFANVFNAKEKICVDGECLTKDDIKALLLLAHPSSTSSGPSAPTQTLDPSPAPIQEEPVSETDPVSDPVPDPEPVVDPAPTPEPVLEPTPDPEPVAEPSPDSEPILESEPVAL